MNGSLSSFRARLHALRMRVPGLIHRPSRGSLRFQFTCGILIVLVPAFTFSYVVLNRLAVKEISRMARMRLNAEAELLSYGLREWGNSNRLMLRALALNPVLRQRDLPGAKALLNSLQELYPSRSWQFWAVDSQPRLLAYSGEAVSVAARQRSEGLIGSLGYFQEALQGGAGYGVAKSYLNGKTCMMIAQPVYPEKSVAGGVPAAARSRADASMGGTGVPAGARPNGVLVSCILLEDLASDTGLQLALRDPALASLHGASGDFNRAKPIQSAFVLLGRHGSVLYPATSGVDESLPTATGYEKGYWAPLFRRATQVAIREREFFDSVRVGNDDYFVLINHVDPAWSTMLILNHNQALSSLHKVLRELVRYGLISLLLASLAVYWQCGRIIAPIREAGRALQRISEGDLDARVQHARGDEIGHLLDNVNHAANQLGLYFAREMAHAVTQKQLETAREIQKDFLVSRIPVSDRLEIAPVFVPAYEVGADWYDVLCMGEIFYVIVADVCDKGIPSALYMSVFRSLLRYGLLAHHDFHGCESDPGQRLQQVASRVNDYMATNQGDSMMFATVFMAAVDPGKGVLHYLSAGHEMPIVAGPAGLRSLEPTGPALGLFADATFTVTRVDLEPGAVLVAYTDGVTDARSPEDVAWGREALVNFMAARMGGGQGASELRDELVATVRGHMADAAAFDDFTLMVLRRLA